MGEGVGSEKCCFFVVVFFGGWGMKSLSIFGGPTPEELQSYMFP